MADFNSEEFERHYGEEFGRTLFYLLNYWCRLFVTFKNYSNLYGKSKERVELLNSVSPNVFGHIQDSFFNEVILGISRLTDPVKSGSGRNLTVQLLPKFIEEEAFKLEILSAVDEAIASSDFARKRRNKIISHNDFDIATRLAKEAPSGSIVEIRAALNSIHKPIRMVRAKFEDVDTRPIVTGIRDEFTLLKILFEGKTQEAAFEEDLRKRWKKGDYYDPYPKWLFHPDEEDDWM